MESMSYYDYLLFLYEKSTTKSEQEIIKKQIEEIKNNEK